MVKRYTRQPKARVRVLLFAVVGGIVLGILGMHSLDQDHAGLAASAHFVGATQLTPTGTMATSAMDSRNHNGKDPSDPDDHCGMLAYCLAAVVGSAFLLWAAFVAYKRRPTAHIKRPPKLVRTFVQSVCRPPPDLIRLSILRC